jgi:hypothetical protein
MLPFLSLALMLACSACGKTVVVHTPFNVSDAEYFRQKGNNRLEVDGFVRQANGAIALCATFTVELRPVTDFRRALARDIAGSKKGGGHVITGSAMYKMKIAESRDFARFMGFVRTSSCDLDGHATFTDVPDGEYYLYLFMSTQHLVPTCIPGFNHKFEYMGIYIIDSVRVAGGQTLEHALTRSLDQSAPHYGLTPESASDAPWHGGFGGGPFLEALVGSEPVSSPQSAEASAPAAAFVLFPVGTRP